MIFSEDSRVKIPCILHLVRLGYRYLSLNQVSKSALRFGISLNVSQSGTTTENTLPRPTEEAI